MKNLNVNYRRLALIVTSILSLSACAVGPDYRTPEMAPLAEQYKAAAANPWVSMTNSDSLSKGDWWERFGDMQLNQLMQALNAQNLQIERALAQYEAALAQARGNRADFMPQIALGTSATRSGGTNQQTGTNYRASGDLSWEVDLWGKIRRQVEQGDYTAQVAQADVANLRLSMQAQLARAYFNLRMADEEQRVLMAIVQSYERAVRTNQNRYDQGVAARADVVMAQTQLENARASAINIRSSRQQYESTIAVLLAQSPSQFSIAAHGFDYHIPVIPAELPSLLLSRRADIVAAERQVAAANAAIGVAEAAWFPSLNLNASGVLSHAQLAKWLSAPLNVWSFGPQLALSLFDAGQRRTAVNSRKADYRAQVANYRQTVLSAFKEVEDSLNLVHVLGRQHEVQMRALTSARESLNITNNQYAAGLIDYLSVTQVANTAYNTEINALRLTNQRLNATVDLITALGGGWSGVLDIN